MKRKDKPPTRPNANRTPESVIAGAEKRYRISKRAAGYLCRHAFMEDGSFVVCKRVEDAMRHPRTRLATPADLLAADLIDTDLARARVRCARKASVFFDAAVEALEHASDGRATMDGADEIGSRLEGLRDTFKEACRTVGECARCDLKDCRALEDAAKKEAAR